MRPVPEDDVPEAERRRLRAVDVDRVVRRSLGLRREAALKRIRPREGDRPPSARRRPPADDPDGARTCEREGHDEIHVARHVEGERRPRRDRHRVGGGMRRDLRLRPRRRRGDRFVRRTGKAKRKGRRCDDHSFHSHPPCVVSFARFTHLVRQSPRRGSGPARAAFRTPARRTAPSRLRAARPRPSRPFPRSADPSRRSPSDAASAREGA